VKIGIVGGTGKLGYGLALRLGRAGHQVLIGSRHKAKALETARKMQEMDVGMKVSGSSNPEIAGEAELIILTIPFAGQEAILQSLAENTVNKIVLDATVPLVFDRFPRYAPPEEGSAAQAVQKMLPKARVVSGLHTISAGLLADVQAEIEGDALICGDDEEAKKRVGEIMQDIGLRCFDAGPLSNAQILERITPMLIGLNKRYKRRHVGIKLTGI
jgi:NADPH-dependent F420 reductase